MSVTKIDDTELLIRTDFMQISRMYREKTAQEMKEFMDYVPRQVLIPKVNELADAVNASAPSDSVYNKEETYNKSGGRRHLCQSLKCIFKDRDGQ